MYTINNNHQNYQDGENTLLLDDLNHRNGDIPNVVKEASDEDESDDRDNSLVNNNQPRSSVASLISMMEKDNKKNVEVSSQCRDQVPNDNSIQNIK